MTLAFKGSEGNYPSSTIKYTVLGDGDLYSEVLTITYTAQRRQLVLANKMVETEYNLYYTTLEVRHEAGNWQTIDSGDSIEVTKGDSYTEHPTNQQNSGPAGLAQHRYWKNDQTSLSTYDLERNFSLQDQHEEDAMFKYLYPMTLENDPGVTGLAQLSDPWRKLTGTWNQSAAYFTPAGGEWMVFLEEDSTQPGDRWYKVRTTNTLIHSNDKSWKWQRWAVYDANYNEDTMGLLAELFGASNPDECQVVFHSNNEMIIKAKYKHDYPVSFQVPSGISYSIYDPWHYNQGSGTFSAATVPVIGDSFRVFLNESQTKYTLILPATVYSNGTFHKFAGFSCDSANFGSIQINSQGLATQEVVFNGSGATLVAHYDQIDSGDIVSITSELANIPASSIIEMPINSEIQLYSTAPFQGTTANPITFRGEGSGNWRGISVKSSDLTIENMRIKQADQAILLDLEDDDSCVLQNLTVDSCSVGVSTVIDNFTYTPLDFVVQNAHFTNISDHGIHAQTVDLGNVKIMNCTFSEPLGNSANAINFSIPTDPVWGGESYHAEFDSLQILDNQIEDFNTGIKLQFKASNNDLNWNSSSVERVIVDHNQIARCDTGMNASGDVLLLSHHNILDSCHVGLVVAYPYLTEDYQSCDQLRYRILNETVVGDGSSVGLLDLNPEPTRPYSALTAFIGGCIFTSHDTAAYNPYSAVYQDNLLYGNSHNFPYSFVGYYGCWSENNAYSIGNPNFVNASSGDYHLTSTSPAIDAGWEDFDGDDDTWETDTDDQDPDGTRMDAGALYYDPVPQAPYLTLDVSGNNPVLNWELTATSSGYPDRDIDRFRIYKHYFISKFNQQTSYATVNDGEATSYTDYGFGLNGGTSTATYRVQAIDNLDQSSAWSNSRNTTGMVAMKPTALPEAYQLGNAYPNPFNPSTTLEYGLPITGNVDIRIFDLAGRLVYQEITVNQPAGWYALTWRGENQLGQQVPSGVYLISLTAQGTESREGYDGAVNFSQTEKVILMK
ncbi:MAG: T9SS type A sorting domain-containing protein [Candidatus Marinimicrobia bacterium]|nr:T9SS type A sorting domain-containing protein [Candidatus Neomarinimicrobiota bacterium]